MRLLILASAVILSVLGLGACHGRSPAGGRPAGTVQVTTSTEQVVAGSGHLQGGGLTLDVQIGGTALGGSAHGSGLVLDGATPVQR